MVKIGRLRKGRSTFRPQLLSATSWSSLDSKKISWSWSIASSLKKMNLFLIALSADFFSSICRRKIEKLSTAWPTTSILQRSVLHSSDKTFFCYERFVVLRWCQVRLKWTFVSFKTRSVWKTACILSMLFQHLFDRLKHQRLKALKPLSIGYQKWWLNHNPVSIWSLFPFYCIMLLFCSFVSWT